MSSFYDTINAAIRDFEEHGFDSRTRLDEWMRRITEAARASMVPEHVAQAQLSRTMRTIYARLVEKGGALKVRPGVQTFTLERVKPRLRAELDRRIAASAELIRLNREQMIAKTQQRFSGWATSVPAGGSDAVDKSKVRADLRKALKALPFEERRVLIDQGHKFTATVKDIVAIDGGAIAARWHSHYRQPGYDYREDHKERDDRVYLIRNSWAQEKGLIKPGPAGYTDQITAPGEEVFCRCGYVYLYSPRALPDDMLTAAGRAALGR